MQKALRYITAGILLLCSVVSVWFLLNNLQRLEPALYSAAIVFVIALFFFFKLFTPNFFNKGKRLLSKIVHLKYFALLAVIGIAALGTFIRFSFYYKFSYTPVSDPISFYETAQRISSGVGIVGDTYIAFFPHLAGYDTILGYAMKVISEPWLATIALNTLLDLAGAVILYVLIRRLVKPGSILPTVAAAVWFLSPFNILFSALSLPIVVVNFFILAILLITYFLTNTVLKNKLPAILGLSLLLGLTAGVANCFRPIFPVVLVALFLFFVYILVTNKKSRKLSLFICSSFLLIVLTFFGVQKANTAYVTAQIGMDATSYAGWNFYVGSNSETAGTWSSLDESRRDLTICKDTPGIKECHANLQKAGIERYKSQGISGTLNLFVRKLYVFSSNQTTVYNANDSIARYVGSKTQKTMNVYSAVFIMVLFACSAIFLFRSAKRTLAKLQPAAPIIIFAAILVLGFFFSSVLVETSPRYAQIVYPIFTIFAVLVLATSRNETLNKKS